MISTKPYLMRAIYEWCIDQGYTPFLQVQVSERTRVPREYVKDGTIVLNLGPEATHQMKLGNEEISFQARFNGAAFSVQVPVDAVAAIYARENGQGMGFEVSSETGSGPEQILPDDPSPPETPAPSRPTLTRVK
jgi:stringent starvation protein B